MAKAILNGQTIFGNVALGQGGSNMHDYSTDEQVVGTWIDGSTVYEKTFYSPLPTSGGGQSVIIVHGISNLDKVIERSISNVVAVGSSAGTDSSSQYYTSITSIDATNITYRTTIDGANRYVIIVLRYTKTA
jgi:hypothetical protein